MAIPAQSRWWIVTLLIVGVLLAISALALDRPNVVWDGGEPHCPSCRKHVEEYSSRCAACRADFDWTIAPEDQSPISKLSLSLLEADRLHARVTALGLDAAAAKLASRDDFTLEAAREYLSSVGRGDCGWCGGTAKDLAASDLAKAGPCPLCLGTGNSIDCGGDRRIERGNWGAEKALQAYKAEFADLVRADLTPEAWQAEARRLAERFLRGYAGTSQASEIWFWQRLTGKGLRETDRAAAAAYQRLAQVIETLSDAP